MYDDFAFSGTMRNVLARYYVAIGTSIIVSDYQTYSMEIAGVQCGNQWDGINIVVYDNDLKKIIDKVNVDTAIKEKTMKRY